MHDYRHRHVIYHIGLLIMLLDQVSKRYFANIDMQIYDFLALRTSWNAGIAFSIGNVLPTTILVCGSVCVLLYVISLIYRTHDLCSKNCLILIVFAAVSNIVDRLLFGQVCDFIAISYNDYHFPTFNLADSIICIAGVIYLLRRRGEV